MILWLIQLIFDLAVVLFAIMVYIASKTILKSYQEIVELLCKKTQEKSTYV